MKNCFVSILMGFLLLSMFSFPASANCPSTEFGGHCQLLSGDRAVCEQYNQYYLSYARYDQASAKSWEQYRDVCMAVVLSKSTDKGSCQSKTLSRDQICQGLRIARNSLQKGKTDSSRWVCSSAKSAMSKIACKCAIGGASRSEEKVSHDKRFKSLVSETNEIKDPYLNTFCFSARALAQANGGTSFLKQDLSITQIETPWAAEAYPQNYAGGATCPAMQQVLPGQLGVAVQDFQGISQAMGNPYEVTTDAYGNSYLTYGNAGYSHYSPQWSAQSSPRSGVTTGNTSPRSEGPGSSAPGLRTSDLTHYVNLPNFDPLQASAQQVPIIQYSVRSSSGEAAQSTKSKVTIIYSALPDVTNAKQDTSVDRLLQERRTN